MAEWFNASVLKTDVAERLPRVRLPPLPPKVASRFQEKAWLLVKAKYSLMREANRRFCAQRDEGS